MDRQPVISLLQLEDSTLDADLELAHLERAGLIVHATRVETARDYKAALNNARFDLILADFHLPDFNGLDALAIARDKAPETPFIFCSGMLGEEIAIESLKNGATDYVLKMRLERLAPAVTRAIAEARERLERKRVELALAETENRFRQMADASPVMIWISSADKAWTYCNSLWNEFVDHRDDQSLGSGWTGAIHPEDRARVLSTYDHAFATRNDFTVEFRVQRPGGEYSWVVSRAVPRYEPNGSFAGFIGSCTDITEIKKTEERLRHSAKLESLGVLAGGIAHDFNNLLTGIMGNASLLLDQMPPGSRTASFVENILQSSEAAAQLTRQMLAYSGKGQLVVRTINLSRVVRDVMSLIETSIPRTAQLRLELNPDLPGIRADAAQIQQLVMNLVINAGEATGNSGGLVTVSTSLADVRETTVGSMLGGSSITPGRYVALTVADNGTGMDLDTRTRIFDPFFTTKFTGRGLGLAAVSGIVRGHEAGLTLWSEPGVGTEFNVYFPIVPEKVIEEVIAPLDETQRGNGTILVVDDELIVARTAAIALKKCGYSVIIARDGAEAVAIFREHSDIIDLVLLDMTMPVMPGDIAFQQIRGIRSDIAVIATSGYDEADAFERFGGSVDGFLQKPYRASQLAARVSEVLDKGVSSASIR